MSKEQPRLVSYERRTAEYTLASPTRISPGSFAPSSAPSYSHPAERERRPAQRSYSFQRRQNDHEEQQMGSGGLRRTSNSVAPVSVEGHHRAQEERRGFEQQRRLANNYHQPEPDYPRYRSPIQESYTAHEYQTERRRDHEQDIRPPSSPHNMYQQIVPQDHRNRVYEEISPYRHQHVDAYDEQSLIGRSPTVVQETDILDDGSESDVYQAGTYARAEDAASSSEGEIDDPEFLEIQERENIIKKYSEGPDGKMIDDWENPDSELYKRMDRFGFLHKDESTLTDEQREHKRRIEKEFSREKKWRSMITIWKNLRNGDRPKKLEERVWKGIPAKLRMIVWPQILDADKAKAARPDTYRDLLLRARLVSKDIKQIDLDINRTYRDHEAFRKRYDIKQQSLLNVLAAYSMYNTEVGYCQGFFVPGFPKLTRFEAHFKKVLKKYRPRVYKHLEKQDIPYIYLTKWWFGCFLDRVPFSLALRLWDVYLIEGDSILIAMALNIMKMHEKTIRKLQIDTFMEFIQMRIAIDFGFSDDETMASLRETLTKLRNDRFHIPPPPSENDLSERPTKALGPILSKPLGSIREEQMEIQSRHSLAISTGRSPHPGRKRSKQRSGSRPPPPQHQASNNRLHSATPSGMEDSQTTTSFRDRPPLIPQSKEVPFEIPSRRSSHQNLVTPPPDPRQASLTSPSKGNGVPVYDSDRALCARTASVRDERTGRTVTILRGGDEDDAPRHNRHTSNNSNARVTQGANNVTYIDLGDDNSSVV